MKKKSWAYFAIKRLFDILVSFIMLVILLPLFIIVGLAIVLTSKGHAFYVSTRVGLNGKEFKMVKFRSMIKDAEKMKKKLEKYNEMKDGPTFKMKDDPRITKVGKFIRKTSIDELPQLFNIFAGQMTFVGPRPGLPQEVAMYDDFARNRLLAKPGLTCIWQCSGRNTIDFQTWMKMDNEYLEKRSLWFDFVILLKTVPAVLTSKGAE